MRKTMLALALAVATLSATVVPVSALGTPTGEEPPLADAGLDQRVTVGTTVTLDATGSRDPDGRLVAYRWRVETPDGRTTAPTPPNRGRTSFTVSESGRYEVTVTVTDDEGNTASDTLYVVVDGTPTATPRPSTPAPPTPRSTPAPPVSTATPGPPSATPTTSDTPTTSGTTAPTGPASPTSTDPPSSDPPEPPEPPAPDCADTFGPDCITVPDCTDPEILGDGCIRSLRIEGPDTLDESETGTYTAVTDGFDGEVSFRWQAGEVSRSVERSFSPGEHTVVVTATDGQSTFIAEKTVYVDRNAPPKVSIADPGELEPGEPIVLSLSELRDPDGTVTSVSWTGGSRVSAANGMDNVRSVTVPDGNGSERVEVTALDDDGTSATDSIRISSSVGTDQTSQKVPTTRTAECTFYEYGGKTTDQPIRCWNKETGELVYDRDPNEGPDDFVGPHSHPDWEVDWYRVARPDDDTIRPGSARATHALNPSNPTQVENTARANSSAPRNETLVNTVESASSSPGYEPYEKNGKSVNNDITGDGAVDLQDWQERYGDPTAKSIESDSEKIKTLNSDSTMEDTENGPEETADSGGLSDTVQNAFDTLADSVSSVVGGDSSDDESTANKNEHQEESGVHEVVSDTADAVTEAFENLGSESEGSDDTSSVPNNNGDNTDSDSSSDESCTNTTLGLPICF